MIWIENIVLVFVQTLITRKGYNPKNMTLLFNSFVYHSFVNQFDIIAIIPYDLFLICNSSHSLGQQTEITYYP